MIGAVLPNLQQKHSPSITIVFLWFMAFSFAWTRSYAWIRPFGSSRTSLPHWTTQRTLSMSSSSLSSSSFMNPAPCSSDETFQKKLVLVIAGPTAVGKSDVAAQLCAQNHGLIISADSVQAYQGVQIGANKPSLQERQETPHILIDVADHTDTYNAAEWTRDAILAIESMVLAETNTNDKCDKEEEKEDQEMQSRRNLIQKEILQARASKNYDTKESLLPVVCGGTMMYIQWLVHGRPDAMQPSAEAMQQAATIIGQYQSSNDFAGAVQYVGSKGPVFQQRITKLAGNDWYRLRRILEVALTVADRQDNHQDILDTLYTGERYGGLDSMGYDVRCFFLCPNDRMQHTSIVDERCEQMIVHGLLRETSDLCLSGRMPDMAARAIGYRQTLEYLADESVATSEQDRFQQFLNDFSTATRRYAKKQMAWFRKDKEFLFLPVDLSLPKQNRVEATTAVIQKYCQLSRQEYETSLYAHDGDSARCKRTNEEQGNKMKFYQFQRHILKENSLEFQSALSEALECRQRMQAKKRRVDPSVTDSSLPANT